MSHLALTSPQRVPRPLFSIFEAHAAQEAPQPPAAVSATGPRTASPSHVFQPRADMPPLTGPRWDSMPNPETDSRWALACGQAPIPNPMWPGKCWTLQVAPGSIFRNADRHQMAPGWHERHRHFNMIHGKLAGSPIFSTTTDHKAMSTLLAAGPKRQSRSRLAFLYSCGVHLVCSSSRFCLAIHEA